MTLLALKEYPIVSYPDGRGGTITYYYYDAYTWIAAVLVVAWVAWYVVTRYRRARALRRRPRRKDSRALQRVVKIKNELSQRYLRSGFSSTIHAVGVGMVQGSSDYCIQVFIIDPTRELWPGAGNAGPPATYRGVPLVPIEMPRAGFLSGTGLKPAAVSNKYPTGIRSRQDVIIGGISGANTNLSGQSGTIGFFCTRRSRFSRQKEIHMLSNSHVFADLRRTAVDDSDLILQPSPGESAINRPIGALVKFSPVNFAADTSQPNHVDAAIAKLSGPEIHQPIIPLIGAVRGYVPTADIEPGEVVRKFGRTTGYTEGRVLSIYLDIWIRYDRTGKSAFFKDQVLIEPALPRYAKFVFKGDSGSLLVDGQQHAVGLVFAGTAELPPVVKDAAIKQASNQNPNAGIKLRKVEGYGVANPISDVLDTLKIDLLT